MIYTGDFTKLDMHVHTHYTYGSLISLKAVERFLYKNIDFGLAITDINTIDGALKLYDKYPNRIIVGSQIITKQGAVTGLFLKENIPSGRDINQTIDAILVQDGLVYIPHPLDTSRKTRLSPESLSLALKRCDLVEVFNSRTIKESDNKKTYDLIQPHMRPVCGSDAHTYDELGRTYVKIPVGAKLSPAGLCDSLTQAELVCRKAGTGALLQSKLYRSIKRLAKPRK